MPSSNDPRLPTPSALARLRVTDPQLLPPQGMAGPSRWSSRQLFGSGHEVQIAHGESVYRLRITSLGKLILTK